MTEPSPNPPPASAAARVDWRNVFRYTLALFVATFLAGCAGGFIVASARGPDGMAPPSAKTPGQLLMVLALVGVFAWIGRAQKVLTAGHAALVWALGCAITFVINVLLLGETLNSYFLSVI